MYLLYVYNNIRKKKKVEIGFCWLIVDLFFDW